MTLTREDRALLERAIAAASEAERDAAADAFRRMLGGRRALTPKQRAWAEGIAEGRFVEPEPQYENLVSSGRVPRGREVETPAVLRDLPKRPPGAR